MSYVKKIWKGKARKVCEAAYHVGKLRRLVESEVCWVESEDQVTELLDYFKKVWGEQSVSVGSIEELVEGKAQDVASDCWITLNRFGQGKAREAAYRLVELRQSPSSQVVELH